MWLLAQVPEAIQAVGGTPTTVIVAFITICLSVVATLVWVLKHQFITTIPAIQAQHDKSRELFAKTMVAVQESSVAEAKANREQAGAEAKAQREAYERIFSKLCDTFTENITSERKICQEQGTAATQSLAALTSAIREMEKGIVAGVNMHTTQSVTDYRHDIREMVHEGVMGRELYARKVKDDEEAKKLGRGSKDGGKDK